MTMNKKDFAFIVVIVGMWLVVRDRAKATIVQVIDPGVVGQEFPFPPGFIATAQLGTSTEDVLVLFEDNKHLVVNPAPEGFTRIFVKGIGSPSGGGNFDGDLEWGFTDMSGNPILTNSFPNLSIASASHTLTGVAIASPLIVHGMFFNISNLDPVEDIGPDALVDFQLVNGATVGIWVPEPSTFVLGLMGLFMLSAIGMRRSKR